MCGVICWAIAPVSCTAEVHEEASIGTQLRNGLQTCSMFEALSGNAECWHLCTQPQTLYRKEVNLPAFRVTVTVQTVFYPSSYSGSAVKNIPN